MGFNSWLYYKIITLAGSVGAGTNYQVKLLVGESSGSVGYDFHVGGHASSFPSAKNNSGDLRFTDNDGSTALDFWVERVSGVAPNRVATIWVEVIDSLESNTTIYCYYGKNGAFNVSNGANTFPLFDDFDSSSIDLTKWTSTTSAGGTISIASSIVTLANSATNYAIAEILSIGTYATGYAIRANANITPKSGGTNRTQLFLGFTAGDGSAPYAYLNGSETALLQSTGTSNKYFNTRHSSTGEQNALDFTIGSYKNFEVRRNSTTNTIGIEIDGNSQTNSAQIPSGSLYGCIGTENPTTPDNPATIQVDFFLVRKYIVTEPTYSSVGTEQSTGSTEQIVLSLPYQVLSISKLTRNFIFLGYDSNLAKIGVIDLRTPLNTLMKVITKKQEFLDTLVLLYFATGTLLDTYLKIITKKQEFSNYTMDIRTRDSDYTKTPILDIDNWVATNTW